jgi:hypothetical protein
MADSIGRDGTPDPAVPKPVQPPASLAHPGLVEYPRRPGWPLKLHVPHVVIEPFKHVRLSEALAVLTTLVLLVIAAQVVAALLAMIERFVG